MHLLIIQHEMSEIFFTGYDILKFLQYQLHLPAQLLLELLQLVFFLQYLLYLLFAFASLNRTRKVCLCFIEEYIL